MSENMSRYLTFVVVIGSVCLLTYSLHVENKPFFATSIAATFLIHMWTRPGRKDALLAIGIGLFLLAAYALSWPAATRSLSTCVETGIAGLGLGSLSVTGAQAIWREGTARREKLAVFLPSIVMAVSSIIGALALLLTSYLHPKTYDLFLYAFDDSLGFQPSFLMGRVFDAYPALAFAAGLVYAAVPLAIALLYAIQITSPRRAPVDILFVFFGAGIVGLCVYHLYPATGPIFAFSAAFPLNPPAVNSRSLELIDVPSEPPRNAMPSVHSAWALLVWWNSRRRPAWVRAAAALFLALTLLATLGMGEHYLIDLVVAVPFTVALQAAFTTRFPLSQAARSRPLAISALTVLVWLILLRTALPLFHSSPLLPWGAMLITLLVSWRLDKMLWRATAES